MEQRGHDQSSLVAFCIYQSLSIVRGQLAMKLGLSSAYAGQLSRFRVFRPSVRRTSKVPAYPA